MPIYKGNSRREKLVGTRLLVKNPNSLPEIERWVALVAVLGAAVSVPVQEVGKLRILIADFYLRWDNRWICCVCWGQFLQIHDSQKYGRTCIFLFLNISI